MMECQRDEPPAAPWWPPLVTATSSHLGHGGRCRERSAAWV